MARAALDRPSLANSTEQLTLLGDLPPLTARSPFFRYGNPSDPFEKMPPGLRPAHPVPAIDGPLQRLERLFTSPDNGFYEVGAGDLAMTRNVDRPWTLAEIESEYGDKAVDELTSSMGKIARKAAAELFAFGPDLAKAEPLGSMLPIVFLPTFGYIEASSVVGNSKFPQSVPKDFANLVAAGAMGWLNETLQTTSESNGLRMRLGPSRVDLESAPEVELAADEIQLDLGGELFFRTDVDMAKLEAGVSFEGILRYSRDEQTSRWSLQTEGDMQVYIRFEY